MESSRLELWSGAMSGSMALAQSGTVLMSMAPVTIGSHMDVEGLGPHLGFYWDPWATLQSGVMPT